MSRDGFFFSHAKSSAAVISLGIHAFLLVIALSFVAVTVIQKEDRNFTAKTVNRPKMAIKKLQVPVKINKKKPKPKLRRRITVKMRMDRKIPEIRMPEISGIKGGLGSVGAGGLGGAAGLGFSMPEIDVFGIKGKGEKVFIALDSDARVMRDEVGGMRAYTIVKDELRKIISGLPSTTVFNVAVFDHAKSYALFPDMVMASRDNVERVKQWLDPLNEVTEGMGEKDYGVKTLPPGGTAINHQKYNGKFGNVSDGRHWYVPAAMAMEQQADTVFILTGWWGVQDHNTEERATGWSESEIRRWKEKLAKARELLKKENEERLARGEPPRVLRGNNMLVNAYFPGSGNLPREYKQYIYDGRDFAEALHLCRQEYAPKRERTVGLPSQKDDFSVNVVYFAPQDTGISENASQKFKKLTSLCSGQLRVLDGLEAIRSSVAGE